MENVTDEIANALLNCALFTTCRDRLSGVLSDKQRTCLIDRMATDKMPPARIINLKLNSLINVTRNKQGA